MAIFEEKTTGTFRAVLVLTLLFLLTYPFWQLNVRELLWHEGEYAVAVTEMQEIPMQITAHGHQLTDAPVFYLLLAKGLNFCGIPLPFALRLLSVFSWFILTGLVFLICKRNHNLQAACAAAAVMFTTAFSVEMLPFGYPVALTALLMFAGWIVWIDMTLGRSNWNLAWAFAGLFGVLIYANAGMTGLLYFIMPLVFQRRPLTIWKKLNHTGFYLFLLLIAGGILCRLLHQSALPPDPRTALPSDFTFGGYIRDLLVFPVNTFLRLMPWSLLLWAPFCAALIPLTPNPLFGKFHRITFLTLLIMIWFNPASSARDLFYLIPVTAILIGTYYWIIVRRYGFRIVWLAKLCIWVLLCAGLLHLIFLFLPQDITAKIPFALPDFSLPQNPSVLWCCAAQTAGAGLLGLAAAVLLKQRQPLWMVSAVLTAAFTLLILSAQLPGRLQENSKREFAEKLRETLQEKTGDNVIYSNLYGLFAEGYYAGLKLRFAETDKLPKQEETVFVISAVAPSDSNRLWNKLLDITYKETRLFVYRGQVIRSDDEDDDDI